MTNSRSGAEPKSVDGQALRFHRAFAAIALHRITGYATQHAQFLADMSGVTATTEVECAQLSRRPST